MAAPMNAPMNEPPGATGGPISPAPTGTIYALTLYVTGQSVRSERAVANLRRICDRLRAPCEMTVVDVLERPQLAEQEKILATPTVIRDRPLPRRRVIGDLSDERRVVLELDLPSITTDTEAELAP
jgi:circadian clock protein KaiB